MTNSKTYCRNKRYDVFSIQRKKDKCNTRRQCQTYNYNRIYNAVIIQYPS